jgi:uncharacterized protein YdcH (DUF465 family)
MKEGYILDFKNNFQINMNEKQANIDEFIETIEQKKRSSQELSDLKQRNLSCIIRFVNMKNRLAQQKSVFKAWTIYHNRKQKKHRVATYSKNTITRGMLSRIFNQWQIVSHLDGKERFAREEVIFRKALEKEKLTMWSSKVDQLMLYMAQLEDKIKSEVQAREDLTNTYETSLNKGVTVLNRETNLLAENPLIHEISIVVAKQLLQ